MYWIVLILGVVITLLLRRTLAVFPLLAASWVLLVLGLVGGDVWNATRTAGGAGLPASYEAVVGTGTLAAQALMWAACGLLVAAVCVGAVASGGHEGMLEKARSALPGLTPSHAQFASLVALVLWGLGQGPSLLTRTSYLAADGVAALQLATGTMGPLLGVGAMVFALYANDLRPSTRLVALAIGSTWWVCLTAIGTRLAILFPAAVMVAVLVRFVRLPGLRLGLRAWWLLLACLAAVALLLTFEVVHLARSQSHGLSSLAALSSAVVATFSLNPAELLEPVRSILASFTVSYPVVEASAANPPPSSVIWANANPLPRALIDIDIVSQERVWPFAWVPMAMIGEWFGIAGWSGQFAMFFLTGVVAGVCMRIVLARGDLLGLFLVGGTTFVLFVSAAQYPSRWFWRFLSLLVIIPFFTWLVGQVAREVRALRSNSRSRPTPRRPRTRALPRAPVA